MNGFVFPVDMPLYVPRFEKVTGPLKLRWRNLPMKDDKYELINSSELLTNPESDYPEEQVEVIRHPFNLASETYDKNTGYVYRIYSPSTEFCYIGYTVLNLYFAEKSHRSKYDNWVKAENLNIQFNVKRHVPEYESYFDMLAFSDARFEPLISIDKEHKRAAHMLDITIEEFEFELKNNRLVYLEKILKKLKSIYISMQFKDTRVNYSP